MCVCVCVCMCVCARVCGCVGEWVGGCMLLVKSCLKYIHTYTKQKNFP